MDDRHGTALHSADSAIVRRNVSAGNAANGRDGSVADEISASSRVSCFPLVPTFKIIYNKESPESPESGCRHRVGRILQYEAATAGRRRLSRRKQADVDAGVRADSKRLRRRRCSGSVRGRDIAPKAGWVRHWRLLRKHAAAVAEAGGIDTACRFRQMRGQRRISETEGMP